MWPKMGADFFLRFVFKYVVFGFTVIIIGIEELREVTLFIRIKCEIS